MRAANAELDSSGAPRLKRVLTAWDLAIYGLVCVTPSAPATVFGLAQVKSHGHAVDTILVAMVAMVLTAISYGRMAGLYPSAGSAYTYVGRGIHPFLGFVAGWAMLLDYVVNPVFCVMFGTLALMRSLPALPYPVGAALFAGGITYLNLRGIRSTARANQVLLGFMFIVLLSYVFLAIRSLIASQGVGGLFSIKPFYSPSTFSVRDIASATSFSALTYLGFDAVTTLAEDVKNPRRNVMLAAVGVCVFTGLFGGLLVYLGQLVWPDYATYGNVETAFIEVAGRVGGIALFRSMAILLVVAMIGAGLTTQVGAARLLFGMGRDDLIPRRFFAHLHPVRNTPNYNIWLIGLLGVRGFPGDELRGDCRDPQLRRISRVHGSKFCSDLAVLGAGSFRTSPGVFCGCRAAGRRIHFLHRHLLGTGRACQDRRRHLVHRWHLRVSGTHPGLSREARVA